MGFADSFNMRCEVRGEELNDSKVSGQAVGRQNCHSVRWQNCRWNRTGECQEFREGHLNVISIRCPREAVEEAAAYQSLGSGPGWKCTRKQERC